MKLKIEAPKQDPKVSLDIELDEADQAKVKQGLAKFLYFLRNKLPIGVKVEAGRNQSQDKD